MKLPSLQKLQAIILPGLIFQSVVIAGGYATGRELVEFFLSNGPQAGLYGMLVATIVWSLVLATSLEFARLTQSYDYKTFFRKLLGPAWVLYEIVYIITIVLILSVIGSAAGILLADMIGTPPLIGTIILIVTIGVLTFFGTSLIERVLASWSLLLYLVYISFLIIGFSKFGDNIGFNFRESPENNAWVGDGIKYASYNLAIIPTILFCMRHIKTRGEAITGGLLGGVIAIVPGILFYFVLVGFYPQIIEEAVPVNQILGMMNLPVFQLLFQIVIFGTFIETGTALLHALNERVAVTYRAKSLQMPVYLRPAIAVITMVIAVFISDRIGLIALIANGYVLLTYLFLLVFVLPLFTIGVYKILGYYRSTENNTSD
ncbi:MAG: hypothetical protein CMP91_03905 [Gammaproteobacteria bacterium]|nr:hypothetical protein [Gammaproteobacteria bacterium]MAY01788.1 hypothetical protein [Gammaproteobacteria bacterium]|tara:strand:- start:247758 stop:248879 length:1122 start_codon:yes stop_codon:yes gene_type:complete